MANNRFYKLTKEKQKHIIDIALKEFAAKGYVSSSINQISKMAGVSTGNLYYYFENKEDLYLTVVETIFNVMPNLDKNSKLNFWNEIERNVRNRIIIAKENKDASKLLNRLFLYNDSMDDCDVEKIIKEKVQGEFKKIFDIGVQRGFIRSDMPKNYLFNIHLGLIYSTNRWLADNLDTLNNTEEIEKFINNALKIIKITMSPDGGK
jgi:AcrR family transcriptional regulator